MTGIILISRDDFYADENGNVNWGPKSDKEWVKNFIKNQVVFVGYKTWEKIKTYDSLLEQAAKWVIGEPTPDCTIHFGGPASFKKYPPDRLIVHRTREYLHKGLKLECKCGKKLIDVKELPDYTEIIYAIQ